MGTPGERKGGRSHPVRRILGQGRAGWLNRFRKGQVRSGSAVAGWAGGVALTQGLASQVTVQGQLLPGCF